MGYVAGARSILRSSSSVRNAAARVASKPQLKPSPPSFPSSSSTTRNPLSHSFLRRPVGMSFALESAMPYHSATASALMTSLLSVSLHGYGWLPDESSCIGLLWKSSLGYYNVGEVRTSSYLIYLACATMVLSAICGPCGFWVVSNWVTRFVERASMRGERTTRLTLLKSTSDDSG